MSVAKRASLRSAHAPGASPAKPIRIDDDEDPWMKLDDAEPATPPRGKTGSAHKGSGSRGSLLLSASAAKGRASTSEATKAASSTPVKAAAATTAAASPRTSLLMHTPSKPAPASGTRGTSSISDRALVAAAERATAKKIQDEIDRGLILSGGRKGSRSFIPASAVKALAATATAPVAAGSKRRRADSPAADQSDNDDEEASTTKKPSTRRSLIDVLRSPVKLPRPASAAAAVPRPRGKPGPKPGSKKQRTESPTPVSSSSSEASEDEEDDAAASASEEEKEEEEKQLVKNKGGRTRKSVDSASAAFQSASAKKLSSGSRSRPAAGAMIDVPSKAAAASPAKRPRGGRAASSTPKRRTILDEEEVQEEKDDVCTICHDGGFLMVCDQCVHAFHTGCLNAHHESNYEFLKEHQDADSLCCRDVHLCCTQRKEVMHVARADLNAEPEDPADKRMAVKWVGPLKRAGGRKYFRAFTRGPHRFEIGSYVTLLNGDPAPGQKSFLVGEIESLFEDLATHLQMVEIRWMYLPEETHTGRLPSHHPQEVFSTAHTDVNEIECISDLCEVVDETEFLRRAEEDQLMGITEEVRSKAQQVFMLRQRYDHDGAGRFLPLIHGPGGIQRAGAAVRERAVNPRLALATQARPKSAKANQSIYSQACAQLQLSAAPPKLPCRDKEKKIIEKFLVDGIQRGTSNGGLYIAGVPGTGKTATVDRIMRELAARDDLPDFEYVEINGMKLKDPSDLYSALWKALTGRSASNAKACQNLDARFQTQNRKRPVCVLLVDELDFIMTRQQNVIYNLFDWPGRVNSRLIVLGISNTIDLPHLLMPKVHSRLGLQKLHFQPYSHEQIYEIIADRLRDLPAFGAGAIEICARKIASVSGDVRRALQVCRRAAEICEEEQMAREAKTGGGKKKAGAAASAAAASPAAAAATAASDSTVFEVTERHVMAAISDLQNSSFITWLRNRCSPLDQVLLAAMIARIKFAATAPSSSSGGRVLAAGGDEYPLVPLRDLTDQARTIWDTKGMSAYMARSAGLTHTASAASSSSSSAAAAATPYPAPTHGDWGRLVHQWAQLRLVNLSWLVGDVDPLVQLNIIPDDIEEACGKMEVWLKIRSAQS